MQWKTVKMALLDTRKMTAEPKHGQWLIMISTYQKLELFYYGPTNRTSSDEIMKQRGQLTFPLTDDEPSSLHSPYPIL
ncbi:hypothetical protein V6N13_018854 [Hibiscus sabdariffa]